MEKCQPQRYLWKILCFRREDRLKTQDSRADRPGERLIKRESKKGKQKIIINRGGREVHGGEKRHPCIKNNRTHCKNVGDGIFPPPTEETGRDLCARDT